MIFDYIVEMWRLALQGNKQGILFFLSSYFFLVCGYSVLFQLKVRGWPSIKGTLNNVEIQGGVRATHRSDQNFMIDTIYQYTVEGVEYKGTRLSPWLIWVTYNFRFLLKKQLDGITRNDDGNVMVFYNPSIPKKSFLIKPGAYGLFVTLLLALLPIFYYWFEYHGKFF